MKPLLLMRTKGITGPHVTKHAGIPKLSKSAGDHISHEALTAIVPDVVGMTAANADIAITAVGLVPAAVGTVDPVVSQVPSAGIAVANGSTVTYTLTS